MRHKKLPIVPDAASFTTWAPTRENLNALPKALRRFIYDLASDPDIVELMRENFILRQEIAALKRELTVKRAQQNAVLLIDHFFFAKQ
jgi:hypothetical protein